MKCFAIIGSYDNFDTYEDLIKYFQSDCRILNGVDLHTLEDEERPGHIAYSCEQFEVPDDLNPYLIDLIACGLYFQGEWFINNTFSETMVGSKVIDR